MIYLLFLFSFKLKNFMFLNKIIFNYLNLKFFKVLISFAALKRIILRNELRKKFKTSIFLI